MDVDDKFQKIRGNVIVAQRKMIDLVYRLGREDIRSALDRAHEVMTFMYEVLFLVDELEKTCRDRWAPNAKWGTGDDCD